MGTVIINTSSGKSVIVMLNGSQKEFLHHLIDSGSLKFGSFQFKSGRISPDYVSIRQAVSTGRGAALTARALLGILPEDTDYVHGPAYAGIPIAAIIASESDMAGRNLRFGFDLKEETEPKLGVAPRPGEMIYAESGELDGASLNSFASGNLGRAAGADFIFGRPYGGIPFAAVLAKRLFDAQGKSVRWGYSRHEQKKYGAPSESVIVGDMRGGDRTLLVDCQSVLTINGIFGRPKEGDRVTLADDVLTSGGTKIGNLEKLSKAGIKVSSIVVAVDREETSDDDDGVPAAEWMESLGVKVFSVLKLTEVYDYLKDREINGRMIVTPEIYRSFEEYSGKYRSRP